MSVFPRLETGIQGLDILTRGGIPKGRTTLITGKSGTCKSILSLQIASNLARRGIKTMLIAVEEAPEDLVTSGDALGFGTGELVESGMIRMLDLTRPLEGPTFVSGDYDVSGLLHRIEGAVKNAGSEALILDSATALFSPRPPDEFLRNLFYRLIYALRKMNLTAIVTAEAPADYGQLTKLGVEDFVCDLVVIMRNIVDGERRRRSIEVHKYRRSPHYKGEYPCTITAKGLIVFPLDVQERVNPMATERFSSGVKGLDEMNNGGWLRDSIVLVRGPSGSGKTTLSGMYARAGALRGERVIYYGFEETKQILLRNFDQIGLPFDKLEREGSLRVTCRYPEATSPEDLLVEVRLGLDEYKPSLVVLDSVSSIEHSTSKQGFRQFMVGLASLLREHGRSALLTQTIGTFSDHDQTAPYLSTIPDAILLMDYSFEGRELQRSMRVLKMRGSSHATERRQIMIEPGGIRVEPWPRAIRMSAE
jgi:circadian clock protein KaiC